MRGILLPILMQTISQPSVFAGMPFDVIANVFRKKCRLYVALGAMASSDYPTDKAELKALIDDSGAEPFAPLGNMDENIGKVKYSQGKVKIDFHTIPTAWTVTGDFKSVYLVDTTLAWLDDAESKGLLSILIIPEGTDDTYLCLSGVHLTVEGEIDLGGGKAVASLMVEGYHETLGTILKYDTGLTAGV